MARALDRLHQLAFAQLVDLAQSERGSRYPSNGSFVQAKREAGNYWYYQGYQSSVDASKGKRSRQYVGPVGDPETERLREAHESSHERFRERRRIASLLRRAGMPAPTPFDGEVIDALSMAGVFEAGAILVGSMAFQTYSGLLGYRLDDALMQTGDVDVARAQRVLVHLSEADGARETLETLLRRIDPSFTPILDRSHPGRHFGYRNKLDYKVEFLTTGGRRRGSHTDRDELKEIDGVSAQPITFLEYLLDQPTGSVLLHNDGVPVVVPDPARYGVHKLIVAPMRERIAATRGREIPTRAKVAKDVSQAASLIETLHRTHRDNDLAAAWDDAHRRGPSWRKHLLQGVLKLHVDTRRLLQEIVTSEMGAAAWRGFPSNGLDGTATPDETTSSPRVKRSDSGPKTKGGGKTSFE